MTIRRNRADDVDRAGIDSGPWFTEDAARL
jgi:hypothetical protein